ncbi:DUF2798 domain-containing protein [Lysinibacillus sp. NPDC056232]|uniref:DUF2798 domain-containing protein n=2 Tax=unclassified Lysinibacillus TaxID=2636778 RepID=UPI0035DDA218
MIKVENIEHYKKVKFMKINKIYKSFIYTILTGLFTSCFISFILVSINLGYSHTFLIHWLRMWGEAFLCAIICAYIFPKIINKLMRIITFVEK